MRLQVSQKALEMLADFLDAEFKKRLMIDRTFSQRAWAREIGVHHVTLGKWMNRKTKDDPELSAKNYAALMTYFGQPVLDVLGIPPMPEKPRNPLYGK